MLLTLENVAFGYDDKRILENISFTVNEGERIGFIGQNGEGKTTLIRLMLGQLSQDEGSIYRKSGLKCGYLAQTGGYESENTVYDLSVSMLIDRDSTLGIHDELVFRVWILLLTGRKEKQSRNKDE